MQYYSFQFSLMVVERFLKSRSRGWAIFRANLDDFYLEDLVTIFQTSQRRWNIVKKIIKLIERAPVENYYTDVKLRELYRYFEGYENCESTSKGLTQFFSTTYPVRAPKNGAGP